MCTDYRMLDDITKKNKHPLARIQDCLDEIGNARCLSKIDLTSGYYQVRIEPLDIQKTVFNPRDGKHECIAMPCGLANALKLNQDTGRLTRIKRSKGSNKQRVMLSIIVVF